LIVNGGWTLPCPNGVLARQIVSWPFGQLTLTESSIVLSARGPFRRLIPKTVIDLSDVTRVEKLRLWTVGGRHGHVHLRTRKASTDRAAFTTSRHRVRALLEALGERGIIIVERSGVWL
jgi:hypothetical protein